MQRVLAILLALTAFAGMPLIAHAATLGVPGVYRNAAGRTVYVGVEQYLPDPPDNETFDPSTRELGSSVAGLVLVRGIAEARQVLQPPNGPLGVSLYYNGVTKRPTLILIHGNDPQTRAMGFLVPYFVANGINVISYDQRGTGDSSGNWFLSGPPQRAQDVEAIFDAYRSNPHVDGTRLGLWAVSNGGWTAPLVANARPVAFMLLKSPPAESVRDNILYEISQRMRHDGYDAAAVARASDLWNAAFAALDGNATWEAAESAYRDAVTQKWFGDSAMPRNLTFPLPASLVTGFRNAVTYDPAEALAAWHVPTLAFFGTLDRNVDVAHAAPAFARAAAANHVDYTQRVADDCGHSLLVSATGFFGEASKPVRFTAGYPDGMLSWLRSRGILQNSPFVPLSVRAQDGIRD